MGGHRNPYAVLGLHPSADACAIKRTYRRLIRECHPDIHGPEAAERAAALNDAYAILGDPKQREEFDNDLMNILRGWTGKSRWFGWRAELCLQCGRELHRGEAAYSTTYRSKRHDALYCSNACRQRAYRARKAALRTLDAGKADA
jgi:curved DNA-binding protein CbpA